MRPRRLSFARRHPRLAAAILAASLLGVATDPLAADTPPPSTPATRDDFDIEVRRHADLALARAPRARSQVLLEGRMPDDPLLKDGQLASADWFEMLCLALTARATRAPAYAAGLRRYLDAWVSVYQPSVNPVSETDFHYFALAYALARDDLPAPLRTRTEALFRAMASAYLDEDRDHGNTGRNNWQSHRVKLATALSFALRDPALLDRSRQLFRNQVERNIAADGSVYDFIERDALHYAAYSLEGLLSAALVARLAGEDWYWYAAPNGASLNGALSWLGEYASGRKTHREFENTSVGFDRQRAERGVEGFSGLWVPSTAAGCYQLAARLSAHWLPLAQQLGPTPGWIRELLPVPGPGVDQRLVR